LPKLFIRPIKISKMSNKKLSVIIVNYNDHGHLKRNIDSIYEKFGNSLDWEIVLVNNDEKQELADLKLDFSKIKILDHKKNVGFGKAMNMGAGQAEGEFLLILNPDTEIITDNVSDVLEEFCKNEQVGIVGGAIFDENEKVQPWGAGKEISIYDLIRNNIGLSRSKMVWSSPVAVECDWVAGTNLFVKKDLFQELGGFDENFFMYFEDMDLCRRARGKGKKIIFFPDFQISHGNGKSYTDKKMQKSHYYDSMEKYLEKHSAKPIYSTIKIIRKFLIRK
jgi:GT2 family glycosyltransferase